MAKGDYRKKGFEIEIPDDCDSQEVLKHILVKLSRHRTVTPPSDECQKKAKEIVEDFKVKEKERRPLGKEKERIEKKEREM